MSTEETKEPIVITYEFQPVPEFEHYIKTPAGLYGVSRDTNLTSWPDQKVEFSVAYDNGEKKGNFKFTPSKFFVYKGAIYFSTTMPVSDTEHKEFLLKQTAGKVEEVSSLPNEPEQPSADFIGKVGIFTVEKKEDAPGWKHVSLIDNGVELHVLNHQSSTFAYPVGEKIILYANGEKKLYVLYRMPNGYPAISKLLTLECEVKVY